MRANRGRDTAAELAVRRELHRLGFRYRIDRPPIPSVRRRADIVFTSVRLAVFIDGCFWHGCPIHGTWPKANAGFWRAKIETNRRRDADTDWTLVEAGWKVFRAWEHEDPTRVARKIANVVRRRRSRSTPASATRKSKSLR